MDMKESVKSVLSQYANFSGRASRREFWWWILFTVIVYFTLEAVILFISFVFPPTMNADGTVSPSIGGIVSIILLVLMFATTLVLLIPSLAVTVRRLHDTDRTGLFVLAGFIPFVGGIIIIVLCVGESNPGTNQYGLPPGMTMNADHDLVAASAAPGAPEEPNNAGQPSTQAAAPLPTQISGRQRREIPAGTPRMPIMAPLPPTPRAAAQPQTEWAGANVVSDSNDGPVAQTRDSPPNPNAAPPA